MEQVSSLMRDVATRSREMLSTVQQYPTAVKVLGVGTCLLALRFIWKAVYGKIHKHPPELYGLPIIGSLFTMLYYKESFHIKLLPSYGDIVKYNVGRSTLYTVNDAELMTKILQKANNRPQQFVDAYLGINLEPSLVMCNDDRGWSFRRKTVMRNLNLLMNSTKLDKLISNLCQNFTFKELNSIENGQLWYPNKYVSNISFNISFLAIFGRTLDANDERYIEYMHAMHFANEKVFAVKIAGLFPQFIVKKYFGDVKNEYNRILKRLYTMTEEDFNKSFENSDNINDETLTKYIWNDYLKQNNGKMDEMTKKRILADLHILVRAGLDTTGLSLHICILLLAKYPNIQEIVYNELFNVMNGNNNNSDNSNNNRSFELSKLNECPQFRAFINEGLRIATAAPHAIPHECEKDLRCVKYKNGKIICDFSDSNIWDNIGGSSNNDDKRDISYDYIIKANCIIDPNAAYASQYNKNVWNLESDPMALNLNYWLVKDEESGKLKFKNNSNSVPFSVGSRQCAGISLAMKEMASFMANLILNYKIMAENNDAKNVNIKFNVFGAGTVTVKPEIPVLVSKRRQD